MQLNVEQKKLIQGVPAGQALVKGVAGSGKTTVALHRVLYLRRHYCFNPEDRILLVTYNKTLINYLKHIYGKIEDEYRDYYTNIFDGNEDKVEIKTIDSIIYNYYTANIDNSVYKVLFETDISYSVLRECVSELCKKFKKVNVLDNRNIAFLRDEIEWIKSCNYLELEEYQGADRLGRMSTQNKDAPQRLVKNSETRRAIYELMLLYDRRLREKKGYIDFSDVAVMALEHAREKADRKYNHIVVDESQDLTKVQLEFIKLLYNPGENSSFTFIVDTAQSIYPHSWLVKGRSFTSVGFDMTGKSNSLTKNYRTTTQIARAAYSLIEKDEDITGCENYVPPSLIDRQGHYPVSKKFQTEQDEAGYVTGEIKRLLSQGYANRDIVVIARMKRQLERINECFVEEGIPSTVITTAEANFEGDSVRLLSIHAIKGLEFRVVFIIGLNKKVIPFVSYTEHEDQGIQESNERKLLYVGMTRARELLYLSCSGKPSQFIRDIEPDYLRLNPGSKVKILYKIRIDNYLYKDRIVDIYNREEETRQWMIRELMNTYRYQDKMIEVEYKVSNFSQVGSVDIAVSVFHKGKMVPLIFIETKAPGKGVAEGLDQLKSYMGACKTCRYGVITDGNEFLVINHNYEQIDDIPTFHPAMLPSGGQIYLYHDLVSRQRCKLIKSSDTPEHLIVESDSTQEEYLGPNLTKIPMFNSIAAGEPILMDEWSGEAFYLPAGWFKAREDIFMLKVRGDSMEGAGIVDGDLVLVEKRRSAQNRDIVVVAIDDEATLKRYTQMGDTVLLIPENEKYEPIQVKSEQARILGVALSVLREE